MTKTIMGTFHYPIMGKFPLEQRVFLPTVFSDIVRLSYRISKTRGESSHLECHKTIKELKTFINTTLYDGILELLNSRKEDGFLPNLLLNHTEDGRLINVNTVSTRGKDEVVHFLDVTLPDFIDDKETCNPETKECHPYETFVTTVIKLNDGLLMNVTIYEP